MSLKNIEQINPAFDLDLLMNSQCALSLFQMANTSVCSFMSPQIAWMTECLVTLWATEWFLVSVDSFMGP